MALVNPNGNAPRGGDIVVSAELWKPGDEFTVVLNTAQAAEGASFNGTHPAGSKVPVRGRGSGEPAFVEIRGVRAGESLVLVKEF